MSAHAQVSGKGERAVDGVGPALFSTCPRVVGHAVPPVSLSLRLRSNVRVHRLLFLYSSLVFLFVFLTYFMCACAHACARFGDLSLPSCALPVTVRMQGQERLTCCVRVCGCVSACDDVSSSRLLYNGATDSVFTSARHTKHHRTRVQPLATRPVSSSLCRAAALSWFRATELEKGRRRFSWCDCVPLPFFILARTPPSCWCAGVHLPLGERRYRKLSSSSLLA